MDLRGWFTTGSMVIQWIMGQIIWFCLMSSIVHTVFNDFQTCKLEIDVNLQNQADELSPCIFLVLSTVLKLLIEFHVLRKDFDLKNLKQWKKTQKKLLIYLLYRVSSRQTNRLDLQGHSNHQYIPKRSKILSSYLISKTWEKGLLLM